jgi:hypothetical protein
MNNGDHNNVAPWTFQLTNIIRETTHGNACELGAEPLLSFQSLKGRLGRGNQLRIARLQHCDGMM